MTAISAGLRRSTAIFALSAGAMLAIPAHAQQMAANEATIAPPTGGVETVVVTGTAFDLETAPAKASLDTTEPQTIINKSYIEDSVSETGTYTTILAIAPSMTGTDLNGPGLSDNGVKNTLRGLPDGSFGMTFDGIPFGDTNGPATIRNPISRPPPSAPSMSSAAPAMRAIWGRRPMAARSTCSLRT